MKTRLILIILVIGIWILLGKTTITAQTVIVEKVIDEKLLYHSIHLNSADQTILPWYSTDPGESYDFVINATWNFWNTMRTDKNGLPYYMNHQVWRGDFNDRRGIGGDQLAMALSSWNLYYNYSGDESVKEEMKFIADYYLSHSLSPDTAVWPNIPFPYNTLVYSGIYDGDMILGRGYTQPDKAGSFGLELIKLYKMTERHPFTNITSQTYLEAAIRIANTLALHTEAGDEGHSPLPFKVDALTGKVGVLKEVWDENKTETLSNYTSNWSGTMELFLNLIELEAGNCEQYQQAFDRILNWMKTYPLKTNKWGPFFEDIPGWSDTQINAITFAQFIMNHPEYFPDWEHNVQDIFTWVYSALGNHTWEKYGVIVVNEQTAYQTPGNSHTSRQASAELQYSVLVQDTTFIANAVRQLNWATYMVDHDGKNCYPRDEIWMTDGYGDYVRHYLRSMAYMPELAPKDQDHLLSTTSVIQLIEYAPKINRFLSHEVKPEQVAYTMLHYRTFDDQSTEVIRLKQKPMTVLINQTKIQENGDPTEEGWWWQPLHTGGILTIRHLNGNRVTVLNH